MGKAQPLADRFWAFVEKGGPDDCWPWMGNRLRRQQYGLFKWDSRQGQKRAHRVAYFLTHGVWPRICRHSCDNPPCCNPAHLLDGTQKENIRDAIERGRIVPVENGYRARANHAYRLTPEQVATIRQLHAGGTKTIVIARQFEVTPGHVRKIVGRRARTLI